MWKSRVKYKGIPLIKRDSHFHKTCFDWGSGLALVHRKCKDEISPKTLRSTLSLQNGNSSKYLSSLNQPAHSRQDAPEMCLSTRTHSIGVGRL